jgi:hypothetical protein
MYSYTTQADIYSLGVTIKHFQDKLKTDIATKDQPLVDWIIKECTTKSPDKRSSASKILSKIK